MNKKTLKSRMANWAIQFLKNMNLDPERFEGKYHRISYERNETNARWIFNEPTFSDLNLHLAHFPDRYTMCFDQYNRECGFFDYADLKKWVHGNHHNNAADLGRFIFLNQCFELLLKEKIMGHVAELGVYKGNSAFLLNKYANAVGKTCYLFDTSIAIDEFFSDKPEFVIPVPDKSGTCEIRKI